MGIAEALVRSEGMVRPFFTGERGSPGDGARRRAQLDPTILELAEAARNLEPGDPLAATIRSRLGCLYGLRHIVRSRFEKEEDAARDRERAIRMLRAARRTDGPSRLGAEDRLCTAWMLALLLMPAAQAMPTGGGPVPRMDGLLGSAPELGLDPDSPRLRAVFAELESLLPDLRSAEVPDHLAGTLASLTWLVSTARSLHSARTTTDALHVAERAEETMPETLPDGERGREIFASMRTLLSGLPEQPLNRPTGNDEPSDDDRPPDHDPPPASASGTAGVAGTAGFAALMALLEESAEPGFAGAEQLREAVETLTARGPGAGAVVAGLEPVLAALGSVMLAMRTGGSEQLAEVGPLLERLGENDPELASLLVPLLPMISHWQGGSRRDQEALLGALAAVVPEPAGQPATAEENPTDELRVLLRATWLATRLSQVAEEGDEEEFIRTFDATVAELRATAERIGEAHPAHGIVLSHIALAHSQRAVRLRDPRLVREALDLYDRVVRERSLPGPLHAALNRSLPGLLAVGAVGESDPARLTGLAERARAALGEIGEEPLPGERTQLRWGLAEVLRATHAMTGLRSQLDEAIVELVRAEEELEEEPGGTGATGLAWRQAELYEERVRVDTRAAIDAGLRSLRRVAEDVLIQVGAEHALRAARDGANRGLRIASWAIDAGQLPQAVAALEAGRALVLRAATASASVPERLAALGHRELAEEWRRAERAPRGAPPQGPEALLAQLGSPDEVVPGALRRRALAALGDELTELLAVPELPELCGAVAAGGADALVYLLPGAALVVGPEAGTERALRLPGLERDALGPVEDYLAAAARRSERPGEPAEQAAWETALERVCGWAGREVMGPLLDRVRATPGHAADAPPPRLVLVSCGDLGVVPWHAARLPGGQHALERAVFSYAASGAQFRAAAGRRRVPPGERPVLVADPTLRLLWAVDEVTTLRANCYERAVLYGELVDESVPVAGGGTPEELLSVLPGGAGPAASLLHIASHGSAGARPTVSALELAGRLTVARVLDRPEGRPGARPGAAEPGPLVVLSACETDLSTRDHDEALTLTTAFVARGAADAVGTRWTATDGAAALLMAVFHDRLTAGGLAPPDALRAAQLWMLDPARTPPPGVVGRLRREAERPELSRLVCWAPFIHQGNPGPA
ncbi:CHAT domain-containing protein [Streptomyces sp. 3MP-14]|uniref:CHAT domain-containing protein n=1 Tax=Streptomyces mimosae TaxID=2586635 RepID=A0A5N6ACP8_9ACTN|nr:MULTISPECIES: CHAT domain-containing protein [Streptomyces]KAB8165716.1 CHAT domain-containing protein [Streptomyces mimosae]KAB8176105.1 CHAT domain-containing protein [Streptomyces sp. 3MP-14]